MYMEQPRSRPFRSAFLRAAWSYDPLAPLLMPFGVEVNVLDSANEVDGVAGLRRGDRMMRQRLPRLLPLLLLLRLHRLAHRGRDDGHDVLGRVGEDPQLVYGGVEGDPEAVHRLPVEGGVDGQRLLLLIGRDPIEEVVNRRLQGSVLPLHVGEDPRAFDLLDRILMDDDLDRELCLRHSALSFLASAVRPELPVHPLDAGLSPRLAEPELRSRIPGEPD